MLSVSLPVVLVLAGSSHVTDGEVYTFAAPVQLTAKGEPMGHTQLYPSPALFDLDGDGSAEMIVGDLIGNLMVHHRLPGDDPTAWSEAKPLEGADGKKLRFHNW